MPNPGVCSCHSLTDWSAWSGSCLTCTARRSMPAPAQLALPTPAAPLPPCASRASLPRTYALRSISRHVRAPRACAHSCKWVFAAPLQAARSSRLPWVTLSARRGLHIGIKWASRSLVVVRNPAVCERVTSSLIQTLVGPILVRAAQWSGPSRNCTSCGTVAVKPSCFPRTATRCRSVFRRSLVFISLYCISVFLNLPVRALAGPHRRILSGQEA